MVAAVDIAHLRSALVRSRLESHEQFERVPLGHAFADTALCGGLRIGALHEIFAARGQEGAATGFAAAIGARAAGKKRVLWIRQDYAAMEFGELAATGFLELGIDPEKLLMLHVNETAGALRAAGDALTCAALGAVVIEIVGEPRIVDLVTSRRLTLSAAQHGVTPFLLRFNADADASAAETRWHVGAHTSPDHENWGSPTFDAELARNRHGRTGHWVMEWNGDDGCFRAPGKAAYSGAMVSASSDRPFATAVEGGRRIQCG